MASGGKVVVWDLNPEEARRSAAALGGSSIGLTVDVTDFDAVAQTTKNTVASLRRIDGLLSYAGITGPVKPTHEYTAAEWKAVVDVCLGGTFNCCSHVPRS